MRGAVERGGGKHAYPHIESNQPPGKPMRKLALRIQMHCPPRLLLQALLLAIGIFGLGPAAGAEDAPGQPKATPPPQLTFPGQPTLQATVAAAHQLAVENLLTLNTICNPA